MGSNLGVGGFVNFGFGSKEEDRSTCGFKVEEVCKCIPL
jgi:hypothetical protein